MTPHAYIEWLDKEIERITQLRRDQDYDYEAVAACDGAIQAYKSVKTKFLTIQFPPSNAYEKRKAAIQNGFDDYCEAHDLPYRNECPLCPPLTDELPGNPSNFTDGLD